jgi:hypothetical protein
MSSAAMRFDFMGWVLAEGAYPIATLDRDSYRGDACVARLANANSVA